MIKYSFIFHQFHDGLFNSDEHDAKHGGASGPGQQALKRAKRGGASSSARSTLRTASGSPLLPFFKRDNIFCYFGKITSI
jgi:hypothetical protein